MPGNLTYGFSDAVDVFWKMHRDAKLLHDEVTGDRLWNFVMTANAIFEWIRHGAYSLI